MKAQEHPSTGIEVEIEGRLMLVAEHRGHGSKSQRYQQYDYSGRESICKNDGADNHHHHRKPDILACEDSRCVKWRNDEQHQCKQDRKHRKQRIAQSIL